MKKIFTLVSYFLFSCCWIAQAGFSLQPVQLTCEYTINPLGIDTKIPRLGWTFASKERNKAQSGYEILVADNKKDIEQGRGNAWSSGKILSSRNIQVEYNGSSLESFTKYYWRLRVYDEKGVVSNWSAVQTFETAMLDHSDWKANWISDGSVKPARDEDYYKNDPMPLLRKDFAAKKKIYAARLYISGMGYYEAYLNGKKISDHVLDPGFTTYRKQVLYVVHDITASIRNGSNVAAVMLGNGWWNPLPFKLFGRWDLRNYQQTGRPCVKAEIHIQYADGTVEKIVTDNSWQTAPGPILKNNIYLGEHYDARLEQKGWNTLGAKVTAWKNATVVNGPDGEMTVQMVPAIKITKIVKPVSVSKLGKDTFIVDMGQNFAGVARIKVKGPAGKKISLRFGEGIFSDGSLNVMTTVATQIKKGGIRGGPGAPETAWQEDGYILKGQGIETWQPRFTFHGFRYVEITGWPGTPTVEDIEGLRMNSDLVQEGTFSCSNEMFNKLHEVIQWTFLSNVFSVQSDCPAREKMGYGADIVVTTNAFIYNYNMAHFYGKAVTDFANEQQPDGGITEIAPFTGIADRGYGGDSGPLGWQLAFPFVQKQLYDFYGDKRIIEQHYPGVKKQMEFLQSKAVDNLFYWDISDHEALDTKPEAFTAGAFYYHHALLAAEFAGILGNRKDSIGYAQLAEKVKKALINKYLVRQTGRFDNSTQSAQIFALWYDLSPEKDSTFKVLMDEFARHNWHLSTGIFSTKMMFDVLSEHNRNDIAYRIATQEDFPGWAHMIENGGATLWEQWAFPETGASRNHPMFGSIDEWFYRSLLGINPAGPGFEKILIRPQPAGDLLWASGSYQSIRGEIKSEWRISGNEFMLKVSIPANTTATVYIPSNANQKVTENDQPVHVLRYENGFAVVETGSGDYLFRSQK